MAHEGTRFAIDDKCLWDIAEAKDSIKQTFLALQKEFGMGPFRVVGVVDTEPPYQSVAICVNERDGMSMPISSRYLRHVRH